MYEINHMNKSFEQADTGSERIRSRRAVLRDLTYNLRRFTMRLPETWILDLVMLTAFVAAGVSVIANWQDVCAFVLECTSFAIVAGMLYLGLRLVQPRRMTRRRRRY